MEDSVELRSYLPLSFQSPTERDYITFLWDAFEANYTEGKHQFAYLAFHMLAMSFIYFNLWQIKKVWPEDFKKGLIGFAKYEKDLLNAKSPFVFSIVPESTVLRFLKLIACDDGQIGNFKAFVNFRNDIAHANGNVVLLHQVALDAKISEILRVVDDIQTQSKPVIEQCYRDFLLQGHDPEQREYIDVLDQIREVLIRSNYLSGKDIEICSDFNTASFKKFPEMAQINTLHKSLCEAYELRGNNE